MKINGILVACLGLLSSACVSTNLQAVKMAEAPESLRGSQIQLSSERVSKEVVAPHSYEVPNRSTFFQQNQGGSAAVGLLFGPLGVLANVANINRITEETGRSGLIGGLYAIDALQEVQAAWEMQPVDTTTAKFEGVIIKPYLVYFVVNQKDGAQPYIQPLIAFRADSRIRNAAGAFENWGANYIYAAKFNPGLDALTKLLSEADLASFRNEVRTGYVELRTELLRDLSKGPMPKRKIAWISSWALAATSSGGRGDIEQGTDGRLSLRINMENYRGPLSENTQTAHMVFVLPSASQYSVAVGPVEREVAQK